MMIMSCSEPCCHIVVIVEHLAINVLKYLASYVCGIFMCIYVHI